MLNDQVNANKAQIELLESELNDYKLTFETLKQFNLEMKTGDLEATIKEQESDLEELAELRVIKDDYIRLGERQKDLEAELAEKTELIEQLNQAKDFLAENNSKLLTNNIKMQLFVETLGFEQQLDIESNSKVREYDQMCEKIKTHEWEMSEVKIKSKQLEIELDELRSQFERSLKQKEEEIAELEDKLEKLGLVVEKVDIYTQYDLDTNMFKIHVYTQYEIDENEQALTSVPKQQIKQYQKLGKKNK